MIKKTRKQFLKKNINWERTKLKETLLEDFVDTLDKQIYLVNKTDFQPVQTWFYITLMLKDIKD